LNLRSYTLFCVCIALRGGALHVYV